jgi:cytochrome c oxidase subunit II
MDKRRIRPILVFGLLLLLTAGFMGSELPAQGTEQVIRITAQKFVYSPRDVTLKKAQPVMFEFTSADVMHGFNCPDLGIRADILPGKSTTLRFTPGKVGTFPFHCDNFCGSGHEQMTGTITITE